MTDQEVQQFDSEGAVTIDTPLTAQQIADACAAFDRLLPLREGNVRPSLTNSYFDPAILDIIQHPFFEEVACQTLHTEQVHFFQTAILTAYPQPHTPFSFWQHVDIQYRLSDFQAVPKNIICSFFLWLTDVNEKRAPMMFRPGSHLLLAELREHDPDWQGDPPKVDGIMLEKLPQLPYADPIPLIAKAGQVSVLTTAAIHGASTNVDTEPRKNLVFTFTAAGKRIGLTPDGEAQRREYNHKLREHLRPERVHIIPTNDD